MNSSLLLRPAIFAKNEMMDIIELLVLLFSIKQSVEPAPSNLESLDHLIKKQDLLNMIENVSD